MDKQSTLLDFRVQALMAHVDD